MKMKMAIESLRSAFVHVVTIYLVLIFTGDAEVCADPTGFPLTDRTYVAWISLDTLDQGGGSVMGISLREDFEGLGYGEVCSRRWMLNSNGWLRTASVEIQQQNLPETSDSNQLIMVAAVLEANTVQLYRNGQPYGSVYTIQEKQYFPRFSRLFFGVRQTPDLGGFSGSIEDARIYNRALTAGELQALSPNTLSMIQPVVWFDFETSSPIDKMGVFTDCTLYGGASIESGRLQLNAGQKLICCNPENTTTNFIHFRPRDYVLGDPIPYYWQGKYNALYLPNQQPWEHIATEDLVHWQVLPSAIPIVGGTGSVIANPGGGLRVYCSFVKYSDGGVFEGTVVRQGTSTDGLQWSWANSVDDSIAPDGVIYKNSAQNAWRDPYVFFNSAEQKWWMLMCSDPVDTSSGLCGLLTSNDALTWESELPLAGTKWGECPDLFQIEGKWYLISGSMATSYYGIADQPRGPFTYPIHQYIDSPGVYAGKRMFDGQRHIWIGWIYMNRWEPDSGTFSWGGTLSMPREIFAGTDQELRCAPAREVIAAFSVPVFDADGLASRITQANGWTLDGQVLKGESSVNGTATCLIDMPADKYMLEFDVNLNSSAQLDLAFSYESNSGFGYYQKMTPSLMKVETGAPKYKWTRLGVKIDTSKAIKIRAFLLHNVLEFFINDEYAFTRHVDDLRTKIMQLKVEGSAEIRNFKVSRYPASSIRFCGEPGTSYDAMDFNKDCHVNLLDFTIFAESWQI